MKRFLVMCVLASLFPTSMRAQQPDAKEAAPTLAALVSELVKNNPDLAVARREIDMRVARIAPAGAPPDPTITAGFMGGFTRPPFFPSSSTAEAFRQISVAQQFPYPGKLALRSQMAATDADAARWTLAGTQLQLVAELKATYFDYQLATRSLAIVKRNQALLDQFRQVAEARFSVGQAIQQDVLKAQLEISSLLERVTVLERQRDTLRARLNQLLNRASDTPISPELAFTVGPVPADVSALRAEAQRQSPALKYDAEQITRSQQQLSLARKETRPDFGINVTTRQPVGGMPWMYGVDIMVTVPIFWQRKQRPMVAEAAAGLDAGRRQRDSTLARTDADVTELYLDATSARKLEDLYSGSILPQARLALESSLASYQVGKAEFLTVLTNFTSVLSYEIGFEEQRTKYHTALARLEPLAAAEFIK